MSEVRRFPVRPITSISRPPRALRRAVDAESAESLIGSARVQGSSFVAHTAAAHVESLAVRIEQIAETSPLAAQYCLPILEALAITAHNEVINLGER